MIQTKSRHLKNVLSDFSYYNMCKMMGNYRAKYNVCILNKSDVVGAIIS